MVIINQDPESEPYYGILLVAYWALSASGKKDRYSDKNLLFVPTSN